MEGCPEVNKTGRSSLNYLQHSHSFKVLSCASHKQFQLSAPWIKGILTVRWKRCREIWIFCFSKVLTSEKCPPSQLFFEEGEQVEFTLRPVRTVRWEGGRTGISCSFRKVTVTLACTHWWYHEQEGSYCCQQFGTVVALILSLQVKQFQHSMLQWVSTSVVLVECQTWLHQVCWKKQRRGKQSLLTLETWSKHKTKVSDSSRNR